LGLRSLRRPIVKSVKLSRNAAKYALMAGRFDKEFAYTPIGAVEPNGQQVQWELINIFRYTDEGRLLEEWVQTDTYEFLRQLSAVAR
jgi:predicted ester cyclase